MAIKGLNLATLARRPGIPAPRRLDPNNPETAKVIRDETHIADATIAVTDEILDSTPGGTGANIDASEDNINESNDKLNRLLDDDFPFDESQLVAIHGVVQEQYACMIGAAGTGKTTVTKKIVDLLKEGVGEVDLANYWQRGEPTDDDDYERPEHVIPSIAMVSFTGRASQMVKKNFPRDWHSNIMTIHRALGFYPEFYAAYDEESGQMRNKRRFVPAYDDTNVMPWDIIIIDEAGMLGLDLWHQLWAACKPGCRIIMIGDINQLPPTHGKSILGFALASWPTWELTHVHRQQGANNSIVDNAHRILKGQHPISDCPSQTVTLRNQKGMIEALNYMVTEKDWRFMTLEIDEEHRTASLRIRQMLQLLQHKLYEPNRDVIITPVNGFEQTQNGYSLGQAPLNQELVVKLNAENPRYFIDAGRERQNFAVGDKVMATVNDYEAGVTNGMTGIITGIAQNGGYTGDSMRYGLITEVNAYLAGLVEIEDDEEVEFSLEEMVSDETLGLDEAKKKEERDAGPASHTVTVRFGEGEHAFEIAFDSKSRVASLMLAYVATCHKMQGGECPLVFVILHNAHKRPLNREWFYTAVTRASERCVVLYTKQGRGFALGKQNIKGTTLAQKIQTFNELTKVGLVGSSVKVKLPQASSLTREIQPYQQQEVISAETEPQEVAMAEPARREDSNQEHTARKDTAPRIRVGSLHIHIHESVREKEPIRTGPETVDGGELRATDVHGEEAEWTQVESSEAPALALPAPARPRPSSMPFEGIPIERLEHEAWVAQQRVPAPTPKPIEKPRGLAALIKSQRNK